MLTPHLQSLGAQCQRLGSLITPSHPCRVCAEPTCSRCSPNAPPIPAAQALTPGRRRRSPSLPVLLPADYLLLCQRWLRGECGIDGLIGKERSCLTLRPLTLRRPRWLPALSRAACGSALVCCIFQAGFFCKLQMSNTWVLPAVR